MIMNGSRPMGEPLGLWPPYVLVTWTLLEAEANLPVLSPWEEVSVYWMDLKEQLIQTPCFIERTPSPGREVGCPRSQPLKAILF